jgi:DHA1 family tetracycline resistance protein-like MFS transporter
MKLKKEYLIVMIIQITEVLGFSLILPFLPLYAEELGATPIIIGLMMTAFSFFQFWTAPVMGKLSDHYGRKPLLIFSQLSTVISFIILAITKLLPNNPSTILDNIIIHIEFAKASIIKLITVDI